jgi:2-polyprenyl-3-methyl-5-hydroxy-6-metoxy-1,4-benzoquinol methylase
MKDGVIMTNCDLDNTFISEGELQYKKSIELIKLQGNEKLGFMTSWAWLDDPKRLTFTLARYKFVSKMIAEAEHALEVGCSDAFASRIVRQTVKKLTAIDFDPNFIADAESRNNKKWPIILKLHDMLKKPVEGTFDAVYSLDVLEHISTDDEDKFISNMIAPLTIYGTAVIGMPSLNSQTYASLQSKLGHINCKHQKDLHNFMKKYFNNVYMFSMNDEVVHTGYDAMAHYHLALCCGKK